MVTTQPIKTWVSSKLAPIWRCIFRRRIGGSHAGRTASPEPSSQALDSVVDRLVQGTIANSNAFQCDPWQAWGKAAGRMEQHIGTIGATHLSDDNLSHRGQATATPGLHLHSVLLAPDGRELNETDIPFRMQSNLASFRHLYPRFTWRLWQHNDVAGLLETAFDADVAKAYHALLPMAYKTDLVRYCLLYQFGGIYSDLSIQHFYSLFEEVPKSLYLFRDGFSQVPWLVSNSIVGAPGRHPFFERLILRVIEHTRSQYYGVNPLCPTGPNLFGRELALHVSPRDIRLGETVRLNKNPSTFSWGYMDVSGELLAVNVKRGGGLASLGFSQTQDYNEMYWQRRIYGPFEMLMTS